jgi:hypothetical protein
MVATMVRPPNPDHATPGNQHATVNTASRIFYWRKLLMGAAAIVGGLAQQQLSSVAHPHF